MMPPSLHTLHAVSPLDGRYQNQTSALSEFFSEKAFMRYRIWVEIEYFIALGDSVLPELLLNTDHKAALRAIYRDFTDQDAIRIKEIEAVTNHDVKAVEYFIKERFDNLGLIDLKEYVHFGLTSQDINNTAQPMMFRDAIHTAYLPLLNEVIERLNDKAQQWKNIPMLARTHGQAASPTLLGKEIYVFVERLEIQKQQLIQIPFAAKFGGATGNFNAHHIAFNNIDWISFANRFVNDILGLSRSQTTTQIEHYDQMAACCDALKRIHTILIDLSRDVWTYISMDYFKQTIREGEVGSSAMPHKVNPIDFENAEGNLGMANAICEHLSSKLPISRLQRDLSDSTVFRNMGIPIAHAVIALKSLKKGLDKIILNETTLNRDLEDNWAVVAEAIQTILRRERYPNAYEALKALTRTNAKIDRQSMHNFISQLDLDQRIKDEMLSITPQNYTGIYPGSHV